MKPLLCVLTGCLLACTAFSQTDTVKKAQYMTTRLRSERLDTNQVVYDEQGNPLAYHQYEKLMNSGDYTIRLEGAPGDKNAKKHLKKLTDEDKERMMTSMKRFSVMKSPALQENMTLDLQPLSGILKTKEFDNKVVVLVFWYAQCPPCTESFESINAIFGRLKNREEVVMLAITRDSTDKTTALLQQKPLKEARIVSGAANVLKVYQVNVFPSYVITDKNHVIRFSTSGQAPLTMTAFENALKNILGYQNFY